MSPSRPSQQAKTTTAETSSPPATGGAAPATTSPPASAEPSADPTPGSAPSRAEHTEHAAGLTYEQARDELVRVVQRLEAGGEPLEESLALWERGEALAARCQEWLDGARARLDAASADATATATDAPGSAAARDVPTGA